MVFCIDHGSAWLSPSSWRLSPSVTQSPPCSPPHYAFRFAFSTRQTTPCWRGKGWGRVTVTAGENSAVTAVPAADICPVILPLSTSERESEEYNILTSLPVKQTVPSPDGRHWVMRKYFQNLSTLDVDKAETEECLMRSRTVRYYRERRQLAEWWHLRKPR